MTARTNGVRNGVTADMMRGDALSPAERKRLVAPLQGTQFAPDQRLFAQYDNGLVFEYGEQTAYRMADALAQDGQLRSLEQVLTLPIRSATWEIVPEGDDTGQTEFVRDTMSDKLPLLIAQATSAITFRKAFFECAWTLDDQGRVVYDEISFRPAVGCEAGFDPKTSKPKGFRQRIVPVGGIFPTGTGDNRGMPGYLTIPPDRSFVFVHGHHRDPIHGVSDLDVALWVHDTKLKILFLLCQFLENQSLPKVIVFGDNQDQADERADAVATLQSSGVLGLSRTGDSGDGVFEILESAGNGGGHFHEFIAYLDMQMTGSVLAGFTDLPQAAVQGTGSYALSADQSEFFLASRQAVADELADAIRRDVLGPLVAYNYGPKAPVPRLKIGPLSSKYQQRGIDLLKAVIQSRYSNIPRGVVEQLVAASASYLGLDPARVRNAIDEAEADIERARAAQDAAATQAGAAGPDTTPGRSSLPEPGLFPNAAAWTDTQPSTIPAGVPKGLASVGMAVDTLHGLVSEQLRASEAG